MYKPAYKQRGFTLLELMVVVVILGLLAAVVAPKVLQNQDIAMVKKAQADIAILEQTLDLYRMDNFQYPTTDQGLEALVAKPELKPLPANYRAGGYIRRLPQDPWGRPYLYLYPGERGDVDIFSMGADGKVDGEGANADIGNW